MMPRSVKIDRSRFARIWASAVRRTSTSSKEGGVSPREGVSL
jgi:hypothetical protein